MDTTHDLDQQAQPVAEQPAMTPEPSPEQQKPPNYTCDRCNKDGFRSLQAVRGHKSTHSRNADTIATTTSSTTYICLVCGMEFGSEESLLRHVTSDHYKDMASNCVDDDYDEGFDLSKEIPVSWPLKGKRNRANSHAEASASNNVRLESEDYTRLLLMAEVCATVASGTLLLPEDDPCLAHAEFVGQSGCKRKRLDDNCVRTLPAAPANRDGENRKFGCEHCEKKFWSHQALGGHMTSHKRAKNSSPDRINGECNRNEQPKVYRCKDCNRTFASSQALGGHRSSPLCKRNKNHHHDNNNNSADAIVVENNNDVVEAHGQDHEQKHKCNDCNRIQEPPCSGRPFIKPFEAQERRSGPDQLCRHINQSVVPKTRTNNKPRRFTNADTVN